MDWPSVLEIAVAGSVGWLITHFYARRSSREVDKLRQLSLKLAQILAATDPDLVSTWDPETGEPSSWPVGTSAQILYDVEAPPPLWKRMWRRVKGGDE